MASRPRWDAIADTYVAVTGDDLDPATAALMRLCGEVDGLHVLDVATGAGRVARALARHGADVTAIDISTGLLECAARLEADEPLGIRFLQADVSAAECLPGLTFDGVACNYGMSDIDNLEGALATVERVLGDKGWFVFSILHPCFPGWPTADAPSSWPPGTGYFDERLWFAGNTGFRRDAGANHRTLSTYLNLLSDHHLAVAQVIEPRVPAEWRSAAPEADEVPVFLAVRCDKR